VLLEKKIKPKLELREWLFRAMPTPNGNEHSAQQNSVNKSPAPRKD
jgi:hypothetical protein